MNIIDVHLHYSSADGFHQVAAEAGHLNTVEHVEEVFRRNRIVAAIAMGSGRGGNDDGLCVPMMPDLAGACSLDDYSQPDYIAYCAGVDSIAITPENTPRSLELFEKHLQSPHCVGLKFYPGYHQIYMNDDRYKPFFELAGACGVPVVIHTGDTAGNWGRVKYSHPLTIDDVAMDFPDTVFVMAHYGNPWIVDATEVAAKNPNVYIDLSGLAAGNFTAEWFLSHYAGYVQHLQTWMTYLSDWGKFMYGSDFPLVNVDAYIDIIRGIVPEEHHERVFYDNALTVFNKLNRLVNKFEIISGFQ